MIPILLALLTQPDLRLESVRESLTGVHCRHRVFVEGLPTDDVIVRRCEQSALEAAAPNTQTHAAAGDRMIDGRRVRRRLVYPRADEPWAEDVDAETGAVVRRVPLFFRKSAPARVFDPNPVVALNDPSLQDRADAASAVPSAAYRTIELLDVADAGPLRGPWATLVDRQLPTVAPPDASGSLLFDREASGFEDVNAYFHIDRNQRYVQSLGYTESRAIAPYSIEVDAHATNGSDTSFFLPSLVQIGRGTLFFGEGGTDDAEDADLVVHEYGHALLEWIAPGAFGGTSASESRALGEGFGDYWAYAANSAQRRASGRDPFCFADWDARCWEDDSSQQCAYPPGSDCLRRLDSTLTMADFQRTDKTGIEHLNGTIWSSALREIRDAIGGVAADTIILEAHFDAPAPPTFAVLARLLLRADVLLYGGAHASTICAAMTARGILSDCASTPRGELTLVQSSDRGVTIADLASITSTLTITDPRVIERLVVRVDLEHEARGDLRIELIAPDGTVVVLQRPSVDRGEDLHVTFGLTATPAESLDVLRGRAATGVWQLRISDERARDAGALLSWGLFVQYSGAERLAARPRAESTQMIPVVARVLGANDTSFRSDLQLANRSSSAVTATLIFTPSGANGLTEFSAVDVAVPPGRGLSLDNVVESVFASSGSGSLEILGEVLAMSRTYTLRSGGTLGQAVPPVIETNTEVQPLLVASIDDPHTRVNLGVTELRGVGGDVVIGEERFHLAPYSHRQFRVPHGVYVIAAESTIAAYLSQVDNHTGDAMFIPAVRQGARPGIAPAISAQGADRSWHSDLWFGDSGIAHTVTVSTFADGIRRDAQVFSARAVPDVLRTLFAGPPFLATLRVPAYPSLFAATRVRTEGATQFVPLLAAGPAEQHLLFVETSAGYRTNVGIATEVPAVADIRVYDAAGVEREQFTLSTEGGTLQRGVTAGIRGGRAVVRFLEGGGVAYASFIDGRNGDATFVAGQ